MDWDTLSLILGLGFYSHEHKVSLDDADVILFTMPTAPRVRSPGMKQLSKYKNTLILSVEQSIHYKGLLRRWRRELESAVASGKSVFVYLRSPEVVYVSADSPGAPGAERHGNRFVTTQLNLDVLPSRLGEVVSGFGHESRATDQSRLLDPYWKKFGTMSRYEGRFGRRSWLVPLLTTCNPDHVVSRLD